MNATDFENTLRHLVRARPFRAFAFVMKDGPTIVAEVPNAVAFNGGGAICVTEASEVFLLDCENVEEIRLVVPEGVQ